MPKDQIALFRVGGPKRAKRRFETVQMNSVQPTTESSESNARLNPKSELDPLGDNGRRPEVTADGERLRRRRRVPEVLTNPPPLRIQLESDNRSAEQNGVSAASKEAQPLRTIFVDVPGSMGDAFNLRPTCADRVDRNMLRRYQSFYVIFFERQMRLSNANFSGRSRQIEERQRDGGEQTRLKSWAMRVEMDSWESPYEPIVRTAKLKPDVVFPALPW